MKPETGHGPSAHDLVTTSRMEETTGRNRVISSFPSVLNRIGQAKTIAPLGEMLVVVLTKINDSKTQPLPNLA